MTPIPDLVSGWVPMKDPLDLKHLGKLGEELGECSSAVCRCLIQGIDEVEPTTGKVNRQWFEEEIADVLAGIQVAREHFKLDSAAIETRVARKVELLRKWHSMLVPK